MTRLNYKIVSGYGQLGCCLYKSAKRVSIFVEGIKDGVLIIDTLALPLKDGQCIADLSNIKDGLHQLTLSYEHCSVKLEPFSKECGRIVPAATENWVIRKLLDRVFNLEAEAKIFKEKIDSLEKSVHGYGLIG